MKPLAETRKFKKLIADIKKANKDPEFRQGIKRFIDIASNRHK